MRISAHIELSMAGDSRQSTGWRQDAEEARTQGAIANLSIAALQSEGRAYKVWLLMQPLLFDLALIRSVCKRAARHVRVEKVITTLTGPINNLT